MLWYRQTEAEIVCQQPPIGAIRAVGVVAAAEADPRRGDRLCRSLAQGRIEAMGGLFGSGLPMGPSRRAAVDLGLEVDRRGFGADLVPFLVGRTPRGIEGIEVLVGLPQILAEKGDLLGIGPKSKAE